MKGWLLDTNVVSALLNGTPSVMAWVAGTSERTMYLSVLTLAEYDKGIHNLAPSDPDRSRFIAARDLLERRFAGRVLGLADPVVRRWGELSGSIKRQTRHPPAVVDTMLAATALEHDLFLVTRNVKDVRHSGAAIFNPWTDDPSQFPLI